MLALLILLALGAMQWSASQSANELALVIADLDQHDPHWRWEQIEADRKPAIPGNNSMTIIEEVFLRLPRRHHEIPTLPNGDQILHRATPANRCLNDLERQTVVEFLHQHQEAVALALTLKDHPHGFASPQSSELCRTVCSLLHADAERLLQDGHAEEAAVRIEAILNTAAALRDTPMFTPQNARMSGRQTACKLIARCLGMGTLQDRTCRRLMARLEAEEQENLLVPAVRGERAAIHDLFENIRAGRDIVPERVIRSMHKAESREDLLFHASSFLYSFRLADDHVAWLRHSTEMCQIAGLPEQEQHAGWDRLSTQISAAMLQSDANKRQILTCSMLPTFHQMSHAAMRDRANLRCARVALAVERFRMVHDCWPQSLEELTPRWLTQVPLDPFSGRPLVYVRRVDGVLVRASEWYGTIQLWSPKDRRLPTLEE